MKPGEKVPDISLRDQFGNHFNFNDLIGESAFVVFFYPKNFTPGCTKEACGFRDNYLLFKELGAEVIGISSDSESSHSKFTSRYCLPYISLSDKTGEARKAFDVKPNLLGLLPGRETFVFDKNGHLLYRFSSMNAKKHVGEALESLKKNKTNF